MISVTIQNVTKRFAETLALDRVSLNIEEGEIFFLLGPSGCGKTTLLRSIAGFYVPDEGGIFFGEENVTHVPPHKRNTGMMFQSYALWPHMNVAKNVAFGLEERGINREEIRRRVAEALASVKMENYADRKIHQLSGGQQQRVALARALVIRPRCLMLDEPLSNLDAKLRLEMRGEIRRICKEAGLTAIYVTHDQKEALSVGDRIAILNAGKVCQVGTPGDVYRHPRSRLVADFMGETNFLDGTADENGTINTPAGRFCGVFTTQEWKPQQGERVLLSIRPECWKLRDENGSGNCVHGRIRKVTYLGEVAKYEFESSGAMLKIYELNPRFAEADANRELFAVADPADVIILPP
jgi:iron(III) transport system ATP-binding protein